MGLVISLEMSSSQLSIVILEYADLSKAMICFSVILKSEEFVQRTIVIFLARVDFSFFFHHQTSVHSSAAVPNLCNCANTKEYMYEGCFYRGFSSKLSFAEK